MSTLTAERLREVLSYDPVTGVFTSLTKRSNKVKVGEPAGSLNKAGYVTISIDGTKYYAHRLAWLYMTGEWPPDGVDHDDRIGSHNWWKNLRPATQSENGANTKKRSDNSTGYKGVSWVSDRKQYKAQLQYKGKTIFVGRYDTVLEAKAAYDAAAKVYFGQFARA